MESKARARDRKVVVDLVRVASGNEDDAVIFIERMRWGDSPACVHCQSQDVYCQRKADGSRVDYYRWRCRSCKRQYSVRHGTVFAESRLPLRHWLHALWRVCSAKKGVSSLQIARECGITYPSALFLMQRIRLVVQALDHAGAKVIKGKGGTRPTKGRATAPMGRQRHLMVDG